MSESPITQEAPTLAHRLRLLQKDMQDKPSQVRGELMREQIQAVLKKIPPRKQASFLGDLARQFPTMQGPPRPAPAAPPGETAKVDPREAFLSLSDEAMAEVVSDLVAQGRIKLPEREPAAPAPAPKAAPGATRMLCDFVRNTVPFFLRTLNSLGIDSDGLVDSDIVARLDAFASGQDADVSEEDMGKALEQVSIAMSSLISVIPHVGKYCTQSLSQQLAPERIEDLSRNEGKSALQRWDAVYWSKYRDMSRAFSDGTLEKDINQRLSAHIDKWLQRARQHLQNKG